MDVQQEPKVSPAQADPNQHDKHQKRHQPQQGKHGWYDLAQHQHHSVLWKWLHQPKHLRQHLAGHHLPV